MYRDSTVIEPFISGVNRLLGGAHSQSNRLIIYPWSL